MKTRVILIVAAIMVLIVLSAGSLNILTPGFSETHKVLVMRSIGHELLKSSGDSTSRVMPVRKLDDQTYLIEFEKNFSFLPDSLMSIVYRLLEKSDFPAQYTVNVLGCTDQAIVYGYEINGRQSLSPCLGRQQPNGCYAVQITFPKPMLPYNQSFIAFAATGIALIGFVLVGFSRKKEKPVVKEEGVFLPIGQYKFYYAQGLLRHVQETIELSRKETTLLKLFAENPNELLLRDRLLKEVWENEGVITGRSLDMFVSKLRKKLRHDPSVKLINVHGKGYRLEV
ncbi:MAG TPA: winged helix-turn-helix domain-containing protein [Cyclobacteriaceae bacterium]|nr:winged helix-turn-helix domain-containing protein [Cyclobacteriaceae bacterium]HMV08847.1 winged helix-turn-helix domain-containing protein [Cyclobacteriaceae bacterium]HMV91208.1 winged helix-turn-helix domain-containing protein [Cyclobacteriaceae bacterium]HMW99993.1 winged helix-turn-helix domain-containing protein [Cyclobacteriaceae bacterium]HMX49144.1 winged helix-turn-helix domain-containing protein [Cyclobacteriaceae bacterium]